MGHPDSKDPPNLYAQCSTDQYVYTHTLNKSFSFFPTYGPPPQLKKKNIGHVDEKLMKGWQQIHVPPSLKI